MTDKLPRIMLLMPSVCWKRQDSFWLARVGATRSTRMQKEEELLCHFMRDRKDVAVINGGS